MMRCSGPASTSQSYYRQVQCRQKIEEGTGAWVPALILHPAPLELPRPMTRLKPDFGRDTCDVIAEEHRRRRAHPMHRYVMCQKKEC